MQKYSWLLPGWLLLLQAAASDRLVGWSDDNTAACRLFPSSYTSQLHDHLLTPTYQLPIDQDFDFDHHADQDESYIWVRRSSHLLHPGRDAPCPQLTCFRTHRSQYIFCFFSSAFAEVKDAQLPTHPSFTCERDYF